MAEITAPEEEAEPGLRGELQIFGETSRRQGRVRELQEPYQDSAFRLACRDYRNAGSGQQAREIGPDSSSKRQRGEEIRCSYSRITIGMTGIRSSNQPFRVSSGAIDKFRRYY